MEELKPIEIQFSGLKASQFFDKKFVELFQKRIENAKFQHFCIYITEEKEGEEEKAVERIWIGHDKIEDANNEIINISTRKSETLEKVIKVVRKFVE